LAKQADLVVTGTIVDVRKGQSYAPTTDSRPEIATSVLVIEVSDVLAGDKAIASDGRVYIEVPHAAFVASGEDGLEVPFDLDAFADTVSRAYGVFFLDDRTKEPYWDTILDGGAGRPEGASITQAFVQGFLIEDPSGLLVSVFEPIENMPASWHSLDSVEEVAAQVD